MALATGGLLLLASCSEAPQRAAASNDSVAHGSAAGSANDLNGQEQSPSLEQAKAELIRLERQYVRALVSKDRAFLETCYAPDFRGGNWMGFWTKSTMLKAVLDDRYTV